jgi:oligopeptide transport system substrate-binding protein
LFEKPIWTVLCCLLLSTSASASGWVLNNPYPEEEANQNIYYTSFSEQPKTLDPAKSYSSNEYQFIGQIYEPVLQYDYLARPYKLVPLTASELPSVQYFDKNGTLLPSSNTNLVAKTVYTIKIKPGTYYQPHPAFAKDKSGAYIYIDLTDDYLDYHDINTLTDFEHMGTRELVADDYIYQIKRLASPHVNSPIFGLMSEYIVGFKDFGTKLPPYFGPDQFIDLRKYPFAGGQKNR